jgi:hypothetical protein
MPLEPAADRPQAKRQIAHEAIGRSPNIPARLNTVFLGSALVGGSALADDRARLPAVAVPVPALISEKSLQLRKGSRQVTAFLLNAICTP